MTPDSALNPAAELGAADGVDPTGPSGDGFASDYADGLPTALAVDFAWMYDDGPNSPNVDCTTAESQGCWGHRDNILISWSGQVGAAAETVNGSVAMTLLYVEAPSV